MKLKYRNSTSISKKVPKINTSQHHALPLLNMDKKTKWSSITSNLMKGNMMKVTSEHCNDFLDNFKLKDGIGKKKINLNQTKSRVSFLNDSSINGIYDNEYSLDNEELNDTINLDFSFQHKFQDQSLRKLQTITKKKHFQQSSCNKLLFKTQEQVLKYGTEVIVESMIKNNSIKRGIQRNLLKKCPSSDQILPNKYMNKYSLEINGKDNPKQVINTKKQIIQLDSMNGKRLKPIILDLMMDKKQISSNVFIRRSKSVSSNIKLKISQNSKITRCTHHNDPIKLLYQRCVGTQLKTIKKTNSSLRGFINIQIPWYCLKNKIDKKMTYLCPIVHCICSRKHILRGIGPKSPTSHQKKKKKMNKEELTAFIVKRRINIRRTNLMQSSLLNILDFEILDEILDYTTDNKFIQIKPLISITGKSVNKKEMTPMMSRKSMFMHQLKIENKLRPQDSNIGGIFQRNSKSPLRRSLVPPKKVSDKIDQELSLFAFNDSSENAIMKLRRSFLKTSQFYVLGKIKGFYFKNVVSLFIQKVQLDSLQNNFASLEGYQRQKIMDLNYSNYLIKDAILKLNVGVDFMRNNNVELKGIIKKRILQIIKQKNNHEEVSRIIQKSRNIKDKNITLMKSKSQLLSGLRNRVSQRASSFQDLSNDTNKSPKKLFSRRKSNIRVGRLRNDVLDKKNKRDKIHKKREDIILDMYCIEKSFKRPFLKASRAHTSQKRRGSSLSKNRSQASLEKSGNITLLNQSLRKCNARKMSTGRALRIKGNHKRRKKCGLPYLQNEIFSRFLEAQK